MKRQKPSLKRIEHKKRYPVDYFLSHYFAFFPSIKRETRNGDISMDSRWADTTDEEEGGLEPPEQTEDTVAPQEVSSRRIKRF